MESANGDSNGCISCKRTLHRAGFKERMFVFVELFLYPSNNIWKLLRVIWHYNSRLAYR